MGCNLRTLFVSLPDVDGLRPMYSVLADASSSSLSASMPSGEMEPNRAMSGAMVMVLLS